jgi:protein-L-isoaspartate(D-aspartate) O-methyltransferase
MSEAAVAPARRETDQAAAMAELRRTMVDRQLRPFDVTDAPLLDQFLATPRELFLPEHQADLAYSDLAVTLRTSAGGKRSLLPPLVLARMLQGAAPRPGQKALVIGGAGYSAALLAGLLDEVIVVESDADLARRAVAGFCALGLANVKVEGGPLAKGAPHHAPFDVILVEGAADAGLEPLFDQLKPDGRLLAIITPETGAGRQLVRFERQDGKATGDLPLLSAGAPVLEGFEKAPAFAF